VYCDNNVSASSHRCSRRPEFEQLLEDLRAGQFERVVVLAQDRLVRRPEQLEDILRLLSTANELGVECVLGGPLDAVTSSGRIQARIKVVFDAAYTDFVSERVRLRKRDLAERGLPPGGGARPFGYCRGGMVIEPSEARLIQEAAARVLAGATLYSICEDWNRRGIHSAQGLTWRSGVLRKMLESPRLAGLREYHGEIIGLASWPAVLDQRTHAMLRAVFSDKDRRHGGRPPIQIHLLSGIARCGRCERTLLSNVINQTRYYVCRKLPSRGGCGRLGIQAEPVEEHVVATLFQALEGRRAPMLATPVPEAQRLAADRAALEDLALRYFVERDLTCLEYSTARAALLARIRDTEQELELHSVQAQGKIKSRGEWQQLATELQRSYLRQHVADVVVQPALRGRAYVDLARVKINLRI
jgi:DNA invertase Pin-like site-specific DNA recombinase